MKELIKQIKQVLLISLRECDILRRNAIYFFCMVFFPVFVTFFFTTFLHEGQPSDMPVGIVDNDNTSTTRSLIRRLDAFQASHVVAYYPNVNEARKAIQENKIYAFLYFPKGTTEKLLSSRQPKISFYYSNTSLTAGAQLMKDLKTISSLGSAAVGQATLRAKGATDKQVQTFLQPIRVDLHAVHNPYTNYNYYLSTFLVPGILLLFIFLISTYSLGTELKFKDSHNLMEMAGNNIHVALIGKFLPQTLIYLIILLVYSWYVFGYLHFPYEGSYWMIIMLAVLTVLVGQAFGIFIFGLMPSLRMSMSICSLWAMLGFTACGATFPVMAMDSPIVALANLFPLRHYYMIYQLCIFNGYPIDTAWFHFMAMGIFLSLPFLVIKNIRKAMLEFQYIP